MNPAPPSVELPLPGARSFLEAVERRLEASLSLPGDEGVAVLAEASRQLCLARHAKRLRPQFAMFCGLELGLDLPRVERIAVAAELIHAASLLHDDVVDNAKERRGRPSANVRYGNSTAVLAGDWVLTQAFGHLEGMAPQTFHLAVGCIAEMTQASILEIEAVGRVDLATWRRIAEGKTGALFAWCGRAVAIEAGCGGTPGPIESFGRHLGVAYQMADDLADLLNPHLGKDRFSDLRNRQPSYPLLVALAQRPELAKQVADAWSWPSPPESAIADLAAQIAAPAVVSAVHEALAQEVAQASAALQRLAEGGPGGAESTLVRAFLASLLPTLGGAPA
jgi:octaprenyl-diphosphate synthase